MMEALLAKDDDLFLGTKLMAEEAQQVRAGKMRRRKKVVKERLPKVVIDYMIATPHPIVGEISEDELAKHTKEYREDYAKCKFRGDKIRAYFQAVIDQYDAFGYADDETEVTGDDEEEMVENLTRF